MRAGDAIGAQVLVRRPRPLPWAFAYAPRGPVARTWSADEIGAFTERDPHAICRRPPGGSRTCASTPRSSSTARATPTDPFGWPCARRAGVRPRRSSRRRPGSSTCGPDEDALWGDLRKKWRQYVNKAKSGGVVVVDAEGDRLGEFYRIYRDTADRAGFLIRTEGAYRDVWEAYRPAGRARLLFAQAADGEPLATLFLVRCGPRVVEPYGGMTQAGCREPGQLPAQVGGHPDLPRAGRHELRPVGPRDRGHRPLQDRLRWSRGPLHRGVGPRARPVRAGGVRGAPVGPASGGRADATAWAAAGTRPPSAARSERGGGRPGDRGGGGRLGLGAPCRRPVVMSTSRWPGRNIGRASGWRPRFLRFDDGFAVLALERSWPFIGGSSAYLPRGPDRRGGGR